MEETLRCYTLKGTWRQTPNGAVCRAVRNGERYVVKRFASRYPGRELARHPHAYLRRFAAAHAVYVRLRRLWRALGRGRAAAGNLNVPVKVFVHDGAVYKATRYVPRARVDGVPLGARNLHRLLSPRQIDVVLRSILAQQAKLEAIGFVHNDYKPGNVIVTERSPGVYVGCVIDYDSGFFVGDVPAARNVVGALEYASPEMLRYLANGEEHPELRACIGCASDMFSLGVLFCELLTGREPCDEEWRWPAERLLKRLPVDLRMLDLRHRRLVAAMLCPNPARRPCAAQALGMLGGA